MGLCDHRGPRRLKRAPCRADATPTAGCDRLATTRRRSLCAADVEAGIEEFDRGVADTRVDRGAVHAGCVDAGLRKFILAVLIAFVDEDVVVDAAGDHIELGMGNV